MKKQCVVDGVTIDFVTGANTSVVANDLISMQAISGNTTLLATTNVLNYTASTAADAAALENKLENNDIVTTNRSLAENDAFVIQYKDSDTNMYSYAIAYIETAGVNASTAITNWEVVDIATRIQHLGKANFLHRDLPHHCLETTKLPTRI